MHYNITVNRAADPLYLFGVTMFCLNGQEPKRMRGLTALLMAVDDVVGEITIKVEHHHEEHTQFPRAVAG